MLSALKNRDYRLLFVGQGVSHIGDQFHLIALPWLVLTLTHDPLQLGLVLAVAGIPRAALMLVGGAFADRHSPRTIMLASDALRFALTAALAAAILAGVAQMWMVYVLALAFGIVSGFFMPAAEATVPRLLAEEHLAGGNALIMGADQLASFLGPAAAGLLIAAFGSAVQSFGGIGEVASLSGIGFAFVLDAASFIVSALSLALMRRLPALNAHTGTNPLADVAAGLRYAWGSEPLRWMVILMAVANFLIAGPLMVGIPVIAESRLTGGAAALGIVLSASGLGSLVGMVAAAGTERPSDRTFAVLLVAMMLGFAVAIGSLAFVTETWVAAAFMLGCGLGNGYIAVTAITAVQRMTDGAFLGRVMSLIMLAGVGLMPVSQALSGAVIKVSPAALFLGAGAGFVAVALTAVVKRSAWTLDAGPLPAATAASAVALEPAVDPVA